MKKHEHETWEILFACAWYLFMLAAIAGSAFGGETITYPAADGVNRCIVEVDDNGYVTSRGITTAMVLEKWDGSVAPESRIYATPHSGDEVTIADGRYILISHDDWNAITGRIAKLETIASRRWAIQHSTEAGRREWHGKPVEPPRIDAEARIKTTKYEDGYTHTEKMTPEIRRPSPPTKPTAPPTQARPSGIPHKAWEARQKRKAAETNAKTVNVRFAPGGKPIEAKESK